MLVSAQLAGRDTRSVRAACTIGDFGELTQAMGDSYVFTGVHAQVLERVLHFVL